MCFGGSSPAPPPDNSAQQQAQAQALSDQQTQAQQQIAAQQLAFNQQQADQQAAQYAQQQQQATDQAQRQSDYDTGRAQLLSSGAQQVNDAFAQFTPSYFNQYATDYMSKVNDQLTQQQNQAEKSLAFGLARQGISSSQAGVNQQGLLDETAGRTLAEQTAQAQQQTAALQGQTAATKQNLLQQVQGAESIGSPIAGSSEQDVNASLATQRSAISGITSTAGDTAASLTAVPPVSTLGDIFAGLVSSGGALQQGFNNNSILAANAQGRAGGTLGAVGPAISSTNLK